MAQVLRDNFLAEGISDALGNLRSVANRVGDQLSGGSWVIVVS